MSQQPSTVPSASASVSTSANAVDQSQQASQSQSQSNCNASKIVSNLSNLKSVQSLHQYQQQNNTNDLDCAMSVEPSNELCPKCNREVPSPSEKIQCMYVSCPQRTAEQSSSASENGKSVTHTRCIHCNDISHCRQCRILLCAKCRTTIRVLQCSFCPAFICSRICFQKMVDNDVAAHSGYLMPHLQFQNPKIRPHNNNLESIPFLSCANCNKQNCGCTDWNACVDCRKFYCDECVPTKMTKCGLHECICATCCQSEQWNRHCRFCNAVGKNGRCNHIFCTKGYCLEHIITDDIHSSSDDT